MQLTSAYALAGIVVRTPGSSSRRLRRESRSSEEGPFGEFMAHAWNIAGRAYGIEHVPGDRLRRSSAMRHRQLIESALRCRAQGLEPPGAGWLQRRWREHRRTRPGFCRIREPRSMSCAPIHAAASNAVRAVARALVLLENRGLRRRLHGGSSAAGRTTFGAARCRRQGRAAPGGDPSSSGLRGSGAVRRRSMQRKVLVSNRSPCRAGADAARAGRRAELVAGCCPELLGFRRTWLSRSALQPARRRACRTVLLLSALRRLEELATGRSTPREIDSTTFSTRRVPRHRACLSGCYPHPQHVGCCQAPE